MIIHLNRFLLNNDNNVNYEYEEVEQDILNLHTYNEYDYILLSMALLVFGCTFCLIGWCAHKKIVAHKYLKNSDFKENSIRMALQISSRGDALSFINDLQQLRDAGVIIDGLTTELAAQNYSGYSTDQQNQPTNTATATGEIPRDLQIYYHMRAMETGQMAMPKTPKTPETPATPSTLNMRDYASKSKSNTKSKTKTLGLSLHDRSSQSVQHIPLHDDSDDDDADNEPVPAAHRSLNAPKTRMMRIPSDAEINQSIPSMNNDSNNNITIMIDKSIANRLKQNGNPLKLVITDSNNKSNHSKKCEKESNNDINENDVSLMILKTPSPGGIATPGLTPGIASPDSAIPSESHIMIQIPMDYSNNPYAQTQSQ